LEHLPHRDILAALKDWVRALRPGGRLAIAVPDFAAIAQAYLDGQPIPVQGYVMGGQMDQDDFHRAIFDREALTDVMTEAGLVGITDWVRDPGDTSSLPISLNLAGYKPADKYPICHAVMTVPRLGWNDFWGCAFSVLGSMGIRLTKVTGAFWEQGLERAFDEALAANPDYLLALDYDTIFCRQDIDNLLTLASVHPFADAIAALQVHRQKPTPLLTLGGEHGGQQTVPWSVFDPALTQCRTAHFGCTLIKAKKLRTLPRPWFNGVPADDGRWGDNRTDPDISFWRAWEAAGNTLFSANRVPVGHLELMVRWPGREMAATWQHPTEYAATGKPEDVWR
jgi:hypothetical protein